MSFLCLIKGHAPGGQPVWNRGYSFSSCRRCRCDMIRSDSEWIEVPRGHKVVWKDGHHEHSRPAGYARNLPMLYRSALRASVPAHWHGGWYRHVLAIACASAERGQGPSQGATAIALPDPEQERTAALPYLVAFAAIAGAGLQLLFAARPGQGS